MPANSNPNELINQYSHNIEVIRDFIQLVKPLLTKEGERQIGKDVRYLLPFIAAQDIDLDSKTKKRVEKALEKEKVTVQLGDEGYVVKAESQEYMRNFASAVDRIKLSSKRYSFLYDMCLMGLINASEWFLGQLLHSYMECYPNKVTDNSDVNFTYNDLEKFTDIEHARSYLIESKIDRILRGSFLDWVNYIKSNLPVRFDRIEKHIDELHEFYLRRNLIVHNGGIINNTYLNSLPSKSDTRKNLKLGQQLSLDENYIYRATRLFEIFYVDIAASLWGQQIKTDAEIEKYFCVFNDLAFKHLKEGRYEVSEHIAAMLMNNAKFSENERYYSRFNYWLSVKAQGRFDDIKKEIEEEDFSAKSDILKLAQMAILEKNKNFYEFIPQVIEPSGSLTVQAFKDWPLFEVQRRSKRKYGQVLKQVREQNEKVAAE